MSFKTAMQAYGKQISVSLSIGSDDFTADDVVSANPSYDGDMFTAVMKCLTVELDGVRTVSSDRITNLTIGAKAPEDDAFSTKTYGTYIIKDAPQFSEDNNSLAVDAYDLMLLSMVPYDLTIQYPITVKGFLDAICDRLGYTKGYPSVFVNSDKEIQSEKYDEQSTFRDVLTEIAQATASTIAFVGDELCILYPNESGEELDVSNMKKLTIGELYGPVNSIVLSRTPQEDNIYRQDAESVETNGLTELKFENNRIVDDDRSSYIEGIFNQINGLTYYLYEMDSYGFGYVELMDRFTLVTLNGERYESIMLHDDFSVGQGCSETSYTAMPAETETDYTAATTFEKKVKETIIKVDKQAGEIELRVEKDGVISAINLSEEEARILASKIVIEGDIEVIGENIQIKDGVITAEKLDVEDLTAIAAKIGAFSITQDGFYSDLNSTQKYEGAEKFRFLESVDPGSYFLSIIDDYAGGFDHALLQKTSAGTIIQTENTYDLRYGPNLMYGYITNQFMLFAGTMDDSYAQSSISTTPLETEAEIKPLNAFVGAWFKIVNPQNPSQTTEIPSSVTIPAGMLEDIINSAGFTVSLLPKYIANIEVTVDGFRYGTFSVSTEGVARFNEKTLLDMTYPIDSVYMSVSSTNHPALLFGGSWEQITNVPAFGNTTVYMWKRIE